MLIKAKSMPSGSVKLVGKYARTEIMVRPKKVRPAQGPRHNITEYVAKKVAVAIATVCNKMKTTFE
ncbi:hypothetical protein TRICHSKD4_1305 [Roseibium sp. TrichSKD4]|nr:hypothetical protein TRICHSKD4_1305 [Roseibium sp. TrichSKD4]